MAFKILLDVNILLDFTLKRSEYKSAHKVFEFIIDGKVTAFISTSILHIAGYWLTKSYGPAKAKEILLELLTDITVIDLPHRVATMALQSNMTDIEDALQYYAAIHHHLNFFISRDKDLKKAATPILPVFTPDELINHLSQ